MVSPSLSSHDAHTLLPHLFRTEFRKIVSVLTKLFGLAHIEIAEDITSDTFLLAAETWGKKGIPDNPTAWLYGVAKNKTKDYLRRHKLFAQSITQELLHTSEYATEPVIDISETNITDSQLQMMFALCHPSIPVPAQIGLSLRILCGFGIDEIAGAFLTNKETINKRLHRAKEKLREENIEMEVPPPHHIEARCVTVLTTLYLLFNEGYYSATHNAPLRKDLCLEAMRLTYMLTEHPLTKQPAVYALLALMCFQASRFSARYAQDGTAILYDEQDTALWDYELIHKGTEYLNMSAGGTTLTKFHLEAAIAYWHTCPDNNTAKWKEILHLYNRLLQIEYSPIAALNRTYALAKAESYHIALLEAKKLQLNSHLYFALLGELSLQISPAESLAYYQQALSQASSENDKQILLRKIAQCQAVVD